MTNDEQNDKENSESGWETRDYSNNNPWKSERKIYISGYSTTMLCVNDDQTYSSLLIEGLPCILPSTSYDTCVCVFDVCIYDDQTNSPLLLKCCDWIFALRIIWPAYVCISESACVSARTWRDRRPHRPTANTANHWWNGAPTRRRASGMRAVWSGRERKRERERERAMCEFVC